MPYDFSEYPYPGFGIKYSVRNIAGSFSDLDLEFADGLGKTVIGGVYSRDFITSETKYAWSASIVAHLYYGGSGYHADTCPSQVLIAGLLGSTVVHA
ncbi:MAG: hypothetical protein MZV63_61940 [Marinilabiliales bacterium]|nr:hypothetical protein [Marinilabiliales bacterium]